MFDAQADGSQGFLSLWVVVQDCSDAKGRCDPLAAEEPTMGHAAPGNSRVREWMGMNTLCTKEQGSEENPA